MGTDDKWTKPGWRIEQKYGTKVLIGNWAEDRLQFTRDCRVSISTYGADYHPQRDHRPDLFIRRAALRRAEGLPGNLLLDHHNIPHSHYLVSHYDENYGQRSVSAQPFLRSWHRDKLAWVPERSDHPAVVPPTNFGLMESWRAHSERQAQPSSRMLSVYSSTYSRPPDSAFRPPRRARTPRPISSHLHPNNRINKDLALKHRPLLQVPDHPDRLLPPVSAPAVYRPAPRDSAQSASV